MGFLKNIREMASFVTKTFFKFFGDGSHVAYPIKICWFSDSCALSSPWTYVLKQNFWFWSDSNKLPTQSSRKAHTTLLCGTQCPLKVWLVLTFSKTKPVTLQQWTNSRLRCCWNFNCLLLMSIVCEWWDTIPTKWRY